MSAQTTFIAKFMKNANGFEFSEIGESVITKLKNGNIAKISLHFSEVCDNFDYIKVKIINPYNGVLDIENFLFSDLKVAPDTGYLVASSKDIELCYDYGKLIWQSVEPTRESIWGLCDKIIDYIKLFE